MVNKSHKNNYIRHNNIKYYVGEFDKDKLSLLDQNEFYTFISIGI